jgi:hypothetical protein
VLIARSRARAPSKIPRGGRVGHAELRAQSLITDRDRESSSSGSWILINESMQGFEGFAIRDEHS